MKLEKLIAIANEAYPDSKIQEAYDSNKDRGVEDEMIGVGDGLAEFISREIVDTYDPKASSLEQLGEAARCMESAKRELTAVAEYHKETYRYGCSRGQKVSKGHYARRLYHITYEESYPMESKNAFHQLKQLIIKHGQVRHNDALESLRKQAEDGYTVVGIYGDNQQPWVTFMARAKDTIDAVKKAIKTIYAKGTNGVELEDIFVIEVFKGYHQGILDPHSYGLPDQVVSMKDLKGRKSK